MFCKKVWLFFVLCGYVNFARSSNLNRNSLSEIQVKIRTFQNEKMHKIIPAFKNEKTKTKMVKRTAAMIVNDDFDIPTNNNNHENSSEIGYTSDENEKGSGFDAFNDEPSETTIYGTTLESNNQKMNRTKSKTNVMEKTEDKVSTLIGAESSGDGTLLVTEEYSTTDVTTKSHIMPEHAVQETIPDICLNSSCSENELSLSTPEEIGFVAGGTNLSLSCKSNYSNHMLYWYKNNGSVHFLKAFGRERELHLNVPDAKPIHSGKYICVRWVNKLTCCSLQLDLTVHDIPLYKYHLIILGLITIACLIICIFLSVRKSMALKTYTKQFVEKHGSTTKQLL